MSFLEKVRKIEKAKKDNWVHRFDTVVDLKRILKGQLENAFLQDEFIHFKEYVNRVMYDFENFRDLIATDKQLIIEGMRLCNLNEYYIELDCLSYTNRKILPIDSFFDDWLRDEKRNRVAILGNCGTGKTSYCLHLTYRLAKEYAESPSTSAVPIFVSLKNYKLFSSIQDLIIDTLRRYCLKIHMLDIFHRLLENGKLILILDGFDEMATSEEKQNILRNLDEINTATTSNSKFVLTCRTNFFRSQEQVESVLSSALPFELLRRKKFEIVELKEFDTDKIQELLSRRTDNWKYYWDIISSTYELEDLAKRPLLLDMIIKTLPELIRSGRKIDSTELYEVYTRAWVMCEDERSTILNEEEREFLMERLACEMFLSKVYKIHYSKLRELVKNEFSQEIFQRRELDCFEKDARTCTFLHRDESGNYEFIHRSFMEFFVAKKFAREIESLSIEDFGKERLTPEIANFLKAMVRNKEVLYRMIESIRGKLFAEVQYLGGNTITLLHLVGGNLSNKDFSNTVLAGANLEGATLEGSDFHGADMKGVNLNNTDLKETDFTNVNLEGASLGEFGEIRSIAFSPDGKHVAVGRYNGDIKIWIVETGEEHLLINGHSGSIWSVCYSPNGKYIASGGWDGYIRIWNSTDGKEVQVINAHDGSVWCVCWSPDGNYIASGGFDKTVKIWDPIVGRNLMTLRGHTKPVLSVCWGPDSKQVVSGSYDKKVKIWNVQKGEEVATLKGHSDFVWCVDYSPDGNYIATGSWDRSVKIWNVQEKMEITTLGGHSGSVWCVCWSPDGNYIASGSGDSRVRVFEVETRKLKFALKEFSGLIFCIKYSPDGKYLAWAGNNGYIITWDIKNQRAFKRIAVDKQEVIDCQGMKIKGIKGLSEDRIRFIKSRGAVE